jgi:hypothetical protein
VKVGQTLWLSACLVQHDARPSCPRPKDQEDRKSEALSGVFGLLGVVVGFFCTSVATGRERKSSASRRADVSHPLLLQRMQNIRTARDSAPKDKPLFCSDAVPSEVYLLGPDTDRYVDAIAGRTANDWA